jgi:TrmH family RNA methyltransferase
MASSIATAARDPRVVRAARLLRDGEFRAAEGAFVADGPDLVAEAIAAGIAIETVFDADGSWRDRVPEGAEHVVAAPDALRALAALGQPPRVAAVCRVPPAPAGPLPARSLVLCGVADAGNVGSLLRTAAALGLPRVELCGGCADPWSRKALRAALGASLAPGLVSARGRSLPELAAEAGRPVLAAAVPRGGIAPAALPAEAVAVVLGSERDGLSEEEVAACDIRVTIPAPGFESLNVAAAGAILGYELVRRRAPAAGGG